MALRRPLYLGSNGIPTEVADGDTLVGDTGGEGGGDVVGPSSATDNAVARFNSTTGKLIQGSLVEVDDNGNIFLPGYVYSSGSSLGAPSGAVRSTGTRWVLKDSLPAYNATTNDWITRHTAGGGTATTQRKVAVNAFINTISSLGLLSDLVSFGCPIAGNGFTGSNIAIVGNNATFVNYVAGDWTTSGLSTNNTKYIGTGYSPATAFASNEAGTMLCYKTGVSSGVVAGFGTNDSFYSYQFGSFVGFGTSTLSDNSSSSGPFDVNGRWCVVRENSGYSAHYRNGVLIHSSTQTPGRALSAIEITMGRINGSAGEYQTGGKILCWVLFRYGLTATQVAAVDAAIDTLINALLIAPTSETPIVDYAAGVALNEMWWSIEAAQASRRFAWYGGETPVMSLDGLGQLDLLGHIVGYGGSTPTVGHVLTWTPDNQAEFAAPTGGSWDASILDSSTWEAMVTG